MISMAASDSITCVAAVFVPSLFLAGAWRAYKRITLFTKWRRVVTLGALISTALGTASSIILQVAFVLYVLDGTTAANVMVAGILTSAIGVLWSLAAPGLTRWLTFVAALSSLAGILIVVFSVGG
jgi:hypothetical protein